MKENIKCINLLEQILCTRHIERLHYGRPEFESHLKDLSRSHPPLSPASLQIHQTVIQIQTCFKIFCNAPKTKNIESYIAHKFQ